MVSEQVVACPEQDARTAVLLIFGQSNSANHGERLYASGYGKAVVNLFEGSCYVAASPLLGASGTGGEPWTELANRLVEAGAFRRAVLITSGIGGSRVAAWQEGGRLHPLLLDVVSRAQACYSITHVIWHQGESDARSTSTEAYMRSFRSMVQSLRRHGVQAPVFVSVASRCGGRNGQGWSDVPVDNPVTIAQRRLLDPKLKILPGVDTDRLVEIADRYDGCHFGARGLEKTAAA